MKKKIKTKKKKVVIDFDKFKLSYLAKAIASIGVCALGGYSMKITSGATGVGWAIFGLLIIWSN